MYLAGHGSPKTNQCINAYRKTEMRKKRLQIMKKQKQKKKNEKQNERNSKNKNPRNLDVSKVTLKIISKV